MRHWPGEAIDVCFIHMNDVKSLPDFPSVAGHAVKPRGLCHPVGW